MNKYLAFDLETGGIDPKEVSLLTAYFLTMDENFNVTGELSLAIRPNSKVYKVTAEALSVNRINLIEHDKIAISPEEAGAQLYKFLHNASDGGKQKLIPLGHNVKFDVDGIQANLMTRNTWETFVSYRPLDTAAVASFLQCELVKLMPSMGGLGKLAEFFGISNKEAHTAKGDVLMTVGVLKAMANLVVRK